MTIIFKNQTNENVYVFVGDECVRLSSQKDYMHSVWNTVLPIEMKFSICNDKTNEEDLKNYYINVSTVAVCTFDESESPILVINKKTNKFQNYTIFNYLMIDSIKAEILDTKYVVDNLSMIKSQNLQLRGIKTNTYLYVIKKSLFDMIIDGLLPSVLLSLLYSWKIAILILLLIFLIALLFNTIKLRTDRSNLRLFNWLKDEDMPDEIEYFLENLDKYCK